jgi:hypothetical protein
MRRSIFLNFAVACALVACGSPVETSVNYSAQRGLTARTAERLLGCNLAVTEVSDLRRDPSTIGSIGGRVVHGPADPQAWMRNVLAGLGAYGATVSFPASAAAAPEELAISVTLMTAWVSGISTAKTSSVVVQVRYRRDGALLKDMRYRGAESDVNWFNSSDEIQAMIDDAMTQVLHTMSDDLVILCASSTG